MNGKRGSSKQNEEMRADQQEQRDFASSLEDEARSEIDAARRLCGTKLTS